MLMVQVSPVTVALADAVAAVAAGSLRVPVAVAMLVTVPVIGPLAVNVLLWSGSIVTLVAIGPSLSSVTLPVQRNRSLLLVTV